MEQFIKPHAKLTQIQEARRRAAPRRREDG
jgi:hypothetical protein